MSPVLVTGGAGFLGARVVARLKQQAWCSEVFVPRSARYDLREGRVIRRLLSVVKPDVIIHCAGRVGGIGYNQANPATLLYDNLMMGAQLLHRAWRQGVRKVVLIGTVCAYPKVTAIPFHESNLWDGYPEETNAPYGLAKRMLLAQANAYRAQYGFNAIYLIPANLYGPGDHVDPERSHVIPALIQKCFDAIDHHDETITVWGDGNATREFLHVDDAARGIVLATEQYDSPLPVNLGTGREISIHELVEKICALTGFGGKVIYDPAKPNGQPRRCLDVQRAKQGFGFEAEIDLDTGLRETVEWYRAMRYK